MNRMYVGAPFYIEMAGESACFTRPEGKRDTVSYPFLVPTAADGILRSVYWKPEFEYLVESVYVNSYVRWAAETLNELKALPVASSALTSAFYVGAGGQQDNTTQRTRMILVGPDYTVKARIVARDKDNVSKHYNILHNRLKKGEAYYLGAYFGSLPHFVSRVESIAEPRRPISVTAGLSPCTYKWLYSADGKFDRIGTMVQSDVSMDDGIIDFSRSMSKWVEEHGAALFG